MGLCMALQAQSISVKSFRPLVGDMTTTSVEGKRIDQNGEVAALIKVMTTETGFVFEGGTLGIVSTQQRVGEIWVWVPRGARKITILHQQLGGLRDYRYPVEIEADRTYEMVLTTDKIETIVKETVRQQYLAFQVSPSNATLEVNGQIWELDADGNAQDYVPFGTYEYRVQALNYHPDAGRVTVNDPENTQFVTVTLRPNFGWIEVAGTDNLREASVYIDNNLVGKAPYKSEALKSGTHSVRIVKKMYATYSETVTVSDNETTRLAPTLEADFAEVTLKVDADAEIWVNNEKKGVRAWTGPLAKGTYKIECKQANHESSVTSKEITSNMTGQTITLPLPTPIYGSLMLESSPKFCKLFVDGKDMGSTPKSINEILIGPHEIRMTMEGYADYVETVTIAKGERKQVTATLSNGKEIQFTCNVADAQLEIDGQRMASANGTYMLTYGQHSLRATAPEYREYTYVLNVSESSRGHGIQMQALVKDEETFTVNGVSFTMKLVEGGTFQMGGDDSDAVDDEKPVHLVTLSNYYMGETEVTQALWKAVMGEEPSRNGEWEEKYGRGNNYPAYRVSWNDISEFIRKLNKKTKKNFRLPTEAEWEYAARGGQKSIGCKYSGSNTIDSVAWCLNNSDSRIHAVKTKSANALGLYDMSGNVYEWCQDWYGRYSNSPQNNPTGFSSGEGHVLRGGSWRSFPIYCRVSSRNSGDTNFMNISSGFRLALSENESEGCNQSQNIQTQPIGKNIEGASASVFSVSPTQKVHFAQGNLQYQASTQTWRFASNQWDMIGNANKDISSSYSGWIDLFCWGTGNDPTKCSAGNDDYPAFTDWGNSIGVGWRTLTKKEWVYVFNNRSTRSGIRYAMATVNGVNGVILLPDDWNSTTYLLNDSNKDGAEFGSNCISSSVWNSTFAPAGAVFLPAAGWRLKTAVFEVGSVGQYWSPSFASGDKSDAYYLYFISGVLNPMGYGSRNHGLSVRLVCPAEN